MTEDPVDWCFEQWEFEVPEVAQLTGSLVERVERIIEMHRNKQLKSPKLLQALALDAWWAILPEDTELPTPVWN
jgi:hypothetical protein